MNQNTQETDKKQKIKKIISDQLGISLNELRDNADLTDDLNAEGIEIADLLAKLEKEFTTNLSAEDAVNLKTVEDIITFFQES